MTNNICIIGAYFGKFPNYFDLWLKSAGKNPKVDFLIFTDAKIEEKPSNVTVIPMTLLQMKKLAAEKLGMQVSLERPYKCCDFKPVYGVIFQDYVKHYDYWGHCDFDLIWGNIYSFLERNEYQKYDKFLNLGHLSLYRNTDVVNSYYMQPGSQTGDYKTVFTTDRNFSFDEFFGINTIYSSNKYPIFVNRIFADISRIYHRYRLALKDKNYNYQVFYWEDGHVFRAYLDGAEIKKDEFIYIHFKKRPNYTVNDDVRDANSFYVTNDGFFVKDAKPITKEIIQKMNPYPGMIYEKFELLKFKYLDYKMKIQYKIGRKRRK